MRRIFKYNIEVIGMQTLVLPVDSHILSVQFQRGLFCVWAIADDQEAATDRVPIRIYGTGHECYEEMCAYMTTVQDITGFVWHVFIGAPARRYNGSR